MKPGYKLTDVGVIPEAWQALPLGSLIRLQAGYSFRSENFTNVGMPVIRISDIQEGSVRVEEATRHPQFKISDDFVIGNGDLLVAMSGATTGKVGVFLSSQPAYQNQRVGRFVVRDKKRTAQGFVGQMVRSSEFRSRLSVLLEQGAQPNVSGKQIESLVFPVPTALAEQHAIAEVLSDLDEFLGALGRFIAKKRDLQQGVMRQLLTGETRLPSYDGEWETKRLGKVAEVHKGAGLSKSSLIQTGNRKCILYGELFTTYGRVIGDVVGRTNSLQGIPSEVGDILLPGSTTTEGVDLATASALLEGGVALGGDINVIRARSKGTFDAAFLANYLTHVKRAAIAERAQGITIIHLYGRDLLDLSVSWPPIDEQIAIAMVLSEIDAELRGLEQRRDKTRAFKQAMMQELLTGRTRLV